MADEVKTVMNPQVRAGLTHVGTAVAAISAWTLWTSQHTGDITALIDKLSGAATQIAALATTLGVVYTTGMSIWNSRPTKKIADAIASGKVEGVVVNDPAIAAKLGPEVQTSVAALPIVNVGLQQAARGNARGV